MCVCVCVCAKAIYIYIYIYIYIINNKYILDIYMFNPWKIVCDPGFHVLQKTP